MTKPTKVWHVVTISSTTGNTQHILYTYNNRGQAVAKLKGLERKGWLHRSEILYAIRRG